MFMILIYDLTTLQRLTITRCAVIAEKRFRFFRHGDQAVCARTPTPPVLARHSKSQKGQFHVYIVERRWLELLARTRWAYTPRLREQKCHGKKVRMDLSSVLLLCTVASPVVGL